jgi:sugar/nucleoside kinase (ribokinase family)
MKIRRTRDVLIAGDANVDLLLHDAPPLELETERLAKGMDLTLGGSSSITAFNLARLGTRVGFISVLGDDFFGRFVAERLRWAGVDLKHLKWLRGQKSGLTIWHIRGTQRAGITYEGTISMLRAGDIPDSYLATFRHLHVGAYFLGKNLRAGAPGLFRRAHKLGLTTSLDCNYDPAGEWDSGIRAVLKESDIFFPNEDEAKYLSGESDARAAARELAKLTRIVAVKRGAQGVLVQSPDGVFERKARRVEAVDGTGAGDSFNAGFLSRFVRGAPLEKCAQAGIEAGARAVTKVGGTTAFE